MSWLKRTVHRLSASTEQLEAEDRIREAIAAGAKPIQECTARERVVVAGHIVAVRVAPTSSSKRFEVDVDDGSGRLTLVFMGRRSVDGVVPGARIKAIGRVCALDGRPAIFNPRYELIGQG